MFALGYFLLELARPEQIVGLTTRTDALYFTLSTLTTVGFGDVYADGQIARALVSVQMVFDVVFVAAGVALLTGRLRGAVVSRPAQAKTRPPDLDGDA